MPTYSYECPQHGAFDVFNVPWPPAKTARVCGMCKNICERVWLPGAWTTPNVGIFKAGYDEALGGYVSSYRGQRELARARGLVRKEDVTVKGRLEYPDVDQFEKALAELKPSEVLAHKERREKMEFEERSGLREPLQGEYNVDAE